MADSTISALSAQASIVRTHEVLTTADEAMALQVVDDGIGHDSRFAWPIKAGRYYFPAFFIPASATSSWSVFGYAAGDVLYYKFYVPVLTTIDRITIKRGTGAGNVVAGIYTCVAGVPSAKVVQTSETSTTSAQVDWTIDSTVLEPGEYFLALHCSATGATFTRMSTDMWPLGVLTRSSMGNGTGRVNVYTETATYSSTLPATAGAVTRGTVTVGANLPAIAYWKS